MSKRLYVGNLSFNTTENELNQAFEPFGGSGAVLPSDHDGRSKGFGFVDVADDQAAAAIAAMNGKTMDGRTLNVNEARPREDRGGSGGGGGRSGGYGGGGGGGGSRGGW